jgi:hypothetical protein
MANELEITNRIIDEIQGAVKPEIIKDSYGNEYSTKKLNLLSPAAEFAPASFNIATLTGLVDFCLKHKDEKSAGDPAVIYIGGPTIVTLYSEPFGPQKQRTLFLKCSFEETIGSSFKFGQFYDQESFVIGLQSLFEPTPSHSEILKMIATIEHGRSAEWTDDGTSQSVIAKTGIAKVGSAKIPNPVYLKPFRTFREIDQPESPFILRIRDHGGAPECALFEGDGGRWKLTAMQRIKEYLEDKISLPIIA